jgi:hypothetical protein
MKLKCIKSIRYLTKGWYYRVVPSNRNGICSSHSYSDMSSHNEYWVYKDDLNQGGWYSADLFQTIEDNRNELIDKIVK